MPLLQEFVKLMRECRILRVDRPDSFDGNLNVQICQLWIRYSQGAQRRQAGFSACFRVLT